MTNLDGIIKKINQIFTDSANESQSTCDNSASLKEIVNAFRLAYQKFKTEYDNLDKLDLGEEISIEDYSPYEDNDNVFQSLIIRVEKPKIIRKPSTYLCLVEEDGKILSYVKSTNEYEGETKYRLDVSLDENIVRGYLELFKKYSALFDFYTWLNDEAIVISGKEDFTSLEETSIIPLKKSLADNKETFGLSLDIDSKSGNFLSDIEDMIISINSQGDLIEIIIDLTTGEIDKQSSQVFLGGNRINDPIVLERLLSDIHVNRDYLNNNVFPLRKNRKPFDKLLELASSPDIEVIDSDMIKKRAKSLAEGIKQVLGDKDAGTHKIIQINSHEIDGSMRTTLDIVMPKEGRIVYLNLGISKDYEIGCNDSQISGGSVKK